MANPFSKGWNYLMQSFDTKIDQNADPKVQIQQAINAAKQQHQEITQQAAAIIGNRNQLQMKLDRLIKSQEDLQTKARTALGRAGAGADQAGLRRSRPGRRGRAAEAAAVRGAPEGADGAGVPA